MTFVTPEVKLIAHTKLANEADLFDIMGHQYPQTDSEYLIEFAGRGCYESWNRPNPATANFADYLKRTAFEQKHGSILEHATATLYFTGVSRAFLAELTRHRHLSFSVRSQRFVNEENAKMVAPPAIMFNSAEYELLEDFTEAVLDYYDGLASNLSQDPRFIKDDGKVDRKKVREAARAVLPQMTETKMVVTGNVRAWIDVIQKRTDPGADAEMIKVMGMARKELLTVSPVLFDRENWNG